MNCINCNDNCNQCLSVCQANNKNGNKINNEENRINYSFTMNGVESCSGGCVYCSAGTTLNYAMGVDYGNVEKSLHQIDEKTYSEFKADFTKMAETLEHNSRFRKCKEVQEKLGKQGIVHIDIWGADPVTCHLATQEVVDFAEDFFIKKHGMKLELSSSTNGLPLMRNDIVDYYREHHITLQISHDGCGQWMRTKDIDPLYTKGYAENIAELFKDGTLNMINDCLNFYNNNVFANKKYYVDYFKSINMPRDKYEKLFIKLNRIYDGEYNIQKKNVKGIFGSDKREWEELKGKPFGDMRHHNAKMNTGNLELDHLMSHELDNYLNDWYKLALLVREPDLLKKDFTWKPFLGYISEQLKRWKPMSSRDESQSICRRYQMTMAGVGDSKYWCKPNEFGEIEMFVIDTIGGYCECNLIDSEHHVKNLGCATVPKQCHICRFYLQSECQGCGSEIFTEDCEWRYRWVQLLENVNMLDKLLGMYPTQQRVNEAYKKGRSDEHSMIANQLLDNFIKYPNSNLLVPQNNHQCNCKNEKSNINIMRK